MSILIGLLLATSTQSIIFEEELVLQINGDGPSVLYDIGQSSFNAKFWNSTSHILKRVCSGCVASHSLIYYKRLTNVTTFDLYSNIHTTWTDDNNIIGEDFNLYSSIDDVVNNQNAWTYCNYDDFSNQIGFARDCGPSGYVPHQWSSQQTQNSHKIFYYYILSGKPATSSEYEYIGCYADTSTRALPYGPHAYGYTVDSCSTACANYAYFALQNGGWCCCGYSYDDATQYGLAVDASWAYNCPSTQLGAGWANDLFRHDTHNEDILSSLSFDYTSTEDFNGDSRSIGWVKYASCMEGYNALTFPNGRTKDELLPFLQFAITLKFLPSTDIPGINETADYAVTADICSNPVIALNYGYILSYSRDEVTMQAVGFENDDDWIGTDTAMYRLWDSCWEDKDERISDGYFYHACGNVYGIHIDPTQCWWDWRDYTGHDLAIWIGFDASKTAWCDRLNSTTDDYLKENMITNLTEYQSVSCDLALVGVGEEIECRVNVTFPDEEPGETTTLSVVNTFNFIDSSGEDTYCDNTTITFSYIENDFDGDHEYIEIYDSSTMNIDALITQCGIEGDKGTCVTKTCLDDQPLEFTDSALNITIFVSNGVDGIHWDGVNEVCPGGNVIESTITIKCIRVQPVQAPETTVGEPTSIESTLQPTLPLDHIMITTSTTNEMVSTEESDDIDVATAIGNDQGDDNDGNDNAAGHNGDDGDNKGGGGGEKKGNNLWLIIGIVGIACFVCLALCNIGYCVYKRKKQKAELDLSNLSKFGVPINAETSM